MKKNLFLLLSILSLSYGFGQQATPAFKDGEWLRYKMSYSGWLRAGSAILEVSETTLQDKNVFYAKGNRLDFRND